MPGWRRFLDEYRSYMQIILRRAPRSSRWSIAGVGDRRPPARADRAQRGHRPAPGGQGRERDERAEVDDEGDGPGAPGREPRPRSRAEELVVGDVVLLAAGDQVPGRRPHRRRQRAADRRVGAHRREHARGQGRRGRCEGGELGPGDQTDMAFMNTPVTHGSGVMIVTAHRRRHRARQDLGDAVAPRPGRSRRSPSSSTRLTLWIAAAAGLTMVVMFVLGRSRGEAWDVAVRQRRRAGDRGDPRGAADRDADDPLARRRRPGQAQRDRQGAAVGRDARLHLGDQLGQDRHADDEPDDRGRGGRPRSTATRSPAPATASRAGSTTPPGRSPLDRGRDPALRRRQRRPAGRRQGRRRPDRGRPARARRTRPGWTSTPPGERLPRLATLPFDPTYKLMATFHTATDADGRPVVRCFVKGAAPAVMARAATALSAAASVPWDASVAAARHAPHGADGAGGASGSWPPPCATSTRPRSTRTATCSPTSPTCR